MVEHESGVAPQELQNSELAFAARDAADYVRRKGDVFTDRNIELYPAIGAISLGVAGINTIYGVNGGDSLPLVAATTTVSAGTFAWIAKSAFLDGHTTKRFKKYDVLDEASGIRTEIFRDARTQQLDLRWYTPEEMPDDNTITDGLGTLEAIAKAGEIEHVTVPVDVVERFDEYTARINARSHDEWVNVRSGYDITDSEITHDLVTLSSTELGILVQKARQATGESVESPDQLSAILDLLRQHRPNHPALSVEHIDSEFGAKRLSRILSKVVESDLQDVNARYEYVGPYRMKQKVHQQGYLTASSKGRIKTTFYDLPEMRSDRTEDLLRSMNLTEESLTDILQNPSGHTSRDIVKASEISALMVLEGHELKACIESSQSSFGTSEKFEQDTVPALTNGVAQPFGSKLRRRLLMPTYLTESIQLRGLRRHRLRNSALAASLVVAGSAAFAGTVSDGIDVYPFLSGSSGPGAKTGAQEGGDDGHEGSGDDLLPAETVLGNSTINVGNVEPGTENKAIFYLTPWNGAETEGYWASGVSDFLADNVGSQLEWVYPQTADIMEGKPFHALTNPADIASDNPMISVNVDLDIKNQDVFVGANMDEYGKVCVAELREPENCGLHTPMKMIQNMPILDGYNLVSATLSNEENRVSNLYRLDFPDGVPRMAVRNVDLLDLGDEPVRLTYVLEKDGNSGARKVGDAISMTMAIQNEDSLEDAWEDYYGSDLPRDPALRLEQTTETLANDFDYDLQPLDEEYYTNGLEPMVRATLRAEEALCNTANTANVSINPTELNLARGYYNTNNEEQVDNGVHILASNEGHVWGVNSDGDEIDATPERAPDQYDEFFKEPELDPERQKEIEHQKRKERSKTVVFSALGLAAGTMLVSGRKSIAGKLKNLRTRATTDRQLQDAYDVFNHALYSDEGQEMADRRHRQPMGREDILDSFRHHVADGQYGDRLRRLDARRGGIGYWMAKRTAKRFLKQFAENKQNAQWERPA